MTDQPMVTATDAPRHTGRIVTFYSFKGGTGRTMALANVAWILASNGHRVLVADWDLESPGLHRFFKPFLAEQKVSEAAGIIDLIREYELSAQQTEPEERLKLIAQLARVEQYAISLDWTHFAEGGSLDFLSPGRQNPDYAAALSALDWDAFYESLNGGEFLDALRTDMKRKYDYALIDSRTGFSDIAEICTVHLPDVLVDCFTLSTQGIEGAANVATQIKWRHKERGIRVLPVPMRVDQAEKKKVDDGRQVAMQRFQGFPEGMSEAQRIEYWHSVEVPYQAFYAYEETLAVFGDKPDLPGSLLSAFERLTSRITEEAVVGMPRMDEQLRLHTVESFTRNAPVTGEVIVIESLAEDQVWAEWIGAVLGDSGVEVRQRRMDEPDDEGAQEPGVDSLKSTRRLVVVSAAYLVRRRRTPLATATPDLAAYVTSSSSLTEFASAVPVYLAGVTEHEGTERLRRLVGPTGGAPSVSTTGKLRYPGSQPKIAQTPVRNLNFTGRTGDLGRLRDELRGYAPGSVSPVVLHGLGGVGKTQVALEYAHRFRTDYDIVCWLDCAQPAFVDAALGDLAEPLRKEFNLNVARSLNVTETTRQVLEALSHSDLRWLLVYDNADDVDVILPLVPSAGGQIIITSRSRAWTDHGARLLPVEVFTRDESVAHLRQRVPSIVRAEAEQIARAVGNLPLAVATTGAWLADTGFTVSEFLNQLARQPHRTLSLLAEHSETVAKVWDVSLNRLGERSTAAVRLFELCSVMAPSISLDLVYSDEMARLLQPFDPTLTEKMVVGRVVQEINRLALIKLDAGAKVIIVHVLVQEVVRDRMSADQIESARRDVHHLLVAARPRRDVDETATWPRYRLIWPHLDASRAMASEVEEVRQLFVDRVRYLFLRGDLARGRALAEETDERWTAMAQNAREPAVVQTLQKQLLQLRFNLGNILRAQGYFAEARELNARVLDEQRAQLGRDHPHTLMTAGSLAADLRAVGRYQEALEMDEQTFPAWNRAYGEDYARTLAAANNLAVSLRLTGAITEATAINSDTYERRRATLGPEDQATISSARNNGWNLLEVGQYGEAVSRLQDTYRIAVEALGKDAKETLDTQVLLAIALRSSGKPAEAEAQFRAAQQDMTRRFGESSIEALACELSNSANLMSLDRYETAAQEILKVLAAYQGRLGQEHPHTLACRLNLAAALRFTGKHDEAMRQIRQAADGFSASLGDEHPYTLAAGMSQGVLLTDQGDLEAAEKLEWATAKTMTRVLVPDHPDTLRCRANLLLTRQQRGDAAAKRQRAPVIDQLTKLLGADHPTVVTLREQRKLMRAVDPQPF
jgi:MinD-like ATPase involved in chromosome partitioning or flagellar assembly/tetratricopeptide (TPR) repeat protein